MSFHLRQINKLPKPKQDIKYNENLKTIKKLDEKFPKLINKTKFDNIDLLNSSKLSNSKSNLFKLIIDKNDQIHLKSYLNQYLQEKIHIYILIETLFKILTNY